jgi:glycosyltransferase involved in cell wall biosynthesis
MANYCIQLGSRTKETKVHFPPLDLTHFQTGARDKALRQSLGFAEDDRVLVYMGSFFYFSGLVDALREFAKISADDSTLRFLLVGGGEQDSELRKLVVELGVQDRVVFTGFIGYQELPRYLKVADVAINTLEPTLVANVAFPNKVLQYMAAGLPVVSTKLEGLAKTFGEDSGISWAHDSREVVGVATDLAQSSDENLLKISQAQFAAVSKIFDVESAVAEFEKSLIELARGFKRWRKFMF